MQMMTYGTNIPIRVKDMDHLNMCSPEDFSEEIHSPTDSSEDSVEVKVEAISTRNKRKCVEPKRVQDGPLKKRMCLQNVAQPFRPWSEHEASLESASQYFQKPETEYEHLRRVSEMSHGYFRPPSPIRRSPSPVEPVPLIKKKDCDDEVVIEDDTDARLRPEMLRVPMHPQVSHLDDTEAEQMIRNSADAFPRLHQSKKEQRNYKNMTRERRIEANARERTRVHTISAAFDTLRRSIPAYSSAQKLSKLSVLRVACTYIMTLSSMLDEDESGVRECVDQVTKTIQREGKLRKKKDEMD